MEFLQQLFLTVCMSIVFSLIISVSIAFSSSKEKASSVVRLEEKRLKVVGGKSKKKVRFVDDVVVRDVEEGSNNDLNFMDKFNGILAKSLEEEISRDEVNNVRMFQSGRKIIEEIGNVKLSDVAEEACIGQIPPIDEEIEKRIEDKNTGYAEVFESTHFKTENSQQVDCKSEMLSAVEETKKKEINSITGSTMLVDDFSSDQWGVEEGFKECISAVLSGDTLKKGAVEETEISTSDSGFGNSSVGKNSINQALSLESKIEFEKDDEDDDWEGIERSDLEKVFAKAVNYVEYGGKGKDYQLINIASNVQIQLYGLHKLAVEGPCYESQPMALKVSARAKWNSWQKLGSMNPELAMEEYIKLLSEIDPDWASSYHPNTSDAKGGAIPTDTNLTMPKELQADNEEGVRFQDKDEKVGPTI